MRYAALFHADGPGRPARRSTRMRTPTVVACVALLSVVLAACGGGEVETPEPSSDPVDTPAASSGLGRQGFPDQCPSTGASFTAMNESAYQVFGQIDYIDPFTGQPSTHNMFIGTAWAVGERLLATNAHVAEAFVDSAQEGIQLSRAIGVQSGTGAVIRLLQGLIHPDYTGDPLRSPDVGLFTSQDALPTVLELAPADSILDLGDEFHLTGFPGDVDEFLTVVPGQTVPQATSLTGSISARRSHDDTRQVTTETLDVYQHQAPTTPGTSGSAIVHCGLVAAINNAGTVQLIVSPGAGGEFEIRRQAAASNNFGVHVRHLHEIIELFDARVLVGFALPVPAVAQAQQPIIAGPIGGGTPGGGESPGGGGTSGGGVQGAEIVDVHVVVHDMGFDHELEFEFDLATGEVTGMAYWGGGSAQGGAEYGLAGVVNLTTWEFSFVDDAPERDPNLPRGFYLGTIWEDGSVDGYYTEDDADRFTLSGSWFLN